jgi:hypothetical protein
LVTLILIHGAALPALYEIVKYSHSVVQPFYARNRPVQQSTMEDTVNHMLTQNVLRTVNDGYDALCGILFYGYWHGTNEPDVSFPFNVWPYGTYYMDSWLRDWQNDHYRWRILRRDVYILRWPSEDLWEEVVKKTLESFLSEGAIIAWGGSEGNFVDPPSLFDPNEMPGSVWAYMTQDGAFICVAELGQEFATIPNDLAIKLHSIIHPGD